MCDLEQRSRGWSIALSLVLAVPTAGLSGFSCAAQPDRDRPVSSEVQNDLAQRHQRGVVGKVTAADGRPITGAVIDAKSLDEPSPPIPERIVLSGAEGRYFWPLLPGDYELRATATGYRAATARVRVEAEELTNADFALDEAR
jgi:protocatechuate 3,4-dioxygenase beta subunit